MSIFKFFKRNQFDLSSNEEGNSSNLAQAKVENRRVDSKELREQYGILCLTAIRNANWEAAIPELENLAQQGFAEACVALGQYYHQSNKVKSNKYFNHGARLGNAECAWGAAGPLKPGYIPDITGKDKDWYDLILFSATNGCSDAMVELGNMYNRKKDYLAAFYWYQKASCYCNPRCGESAIKVIEKWEQDGKPSLCTSIDGVCNADFLSASELFIRILDKTAFPEFVNNEALPMCMMDGNELLGLFLGDFYESVLKRPDNARIFYRTAANNDGIFGAKCLADMMATGNGGATDINGAIELYSKAANRGEASSAFVMGQVELRQHNINMAAYWLCVSYRRGCDYAFDLLKTM